LWNLGGDWETGRLGAGRGKGRLGETGRWREIWGRLGTGRGNLETENLETEKGEKGIWSNTDDNGAKEFIFSYLLLPSLSYSLLSLSSYPLIPSTVSQLVNLNSPVLVANHFRYRFVLKAGNYFPHFLCAFLDGSFIALLIFIALLPAITCTQYERS